MEKYLVQDLLEICEQLGICPGSAKTREAILEVMQAEDVTVSEADETWEDIAERNLEAQERERRERIAEQRKREAMLQECPKQKEMLEYALENEGYEQSRESFKWWKARRMLRLFRTGEDIVTFLADFEKVCEELEVNREYWPQRLIPLLPRDVGLILERLFNLGNRDFCEYKKALLVEVAERELEWRKRNLDAKECEVEAKQRELMEKQCEHEAKMRELEAKERELDEKECEFDVKHSEIKVKESTLEAKKRELEAKERELEEKECEFEVRHSEIKVKESELESKKRELEAKERELETKKLENREQEELASFYGARVIVPSAARRSGDDKEEKRVQLSGDLDKQIESSVHASTSDEALCIASHCQLKSSRRNRGKADPIVASSGKRAKAVNRHEVICRGAKFNSGLEIAKGSAKKKVRFRLLLRSRAHMRRVAKSISCKIRRRRNRPVSSLSLHIRCRNAAKDRVRRSSNKGRSPPWLKGGHSTRRRRMSLLYQLGAGFVHSRSNELKTVANCPDWQANRSSFCWNSAPRKAWTARLPRVRLKGCICGTRR